MQISPSFSRNITVAGLLTALGLAVAVAAFVVSKPEPILVGDVRVDTLPADLAPNSDPLPLLADLRSRFLTVRNPSAILVLGTADSAEAARLETVRGIVEEGQFAFFARLRPNFRLVDPTTSLILTSKDAPFPRTLILIAPGYPPCVDVLPSTMDSLRLALVTYRQTMGLAPLPRL